VWVEATVAAGTATVALGGELDAAALPLVSRQLAQVMAARPDRLVLDLTRLSFLDCAAARVIIGLGSSLPEGRCPVIVCASPLVRRVLEVTGLAARCEIRG
jgi:anti-anti-sigma factor